MKQTINVQVEIETLEEKCSHTCRFLGSEYNAFGSSMVCYLYDKFLINEEENVSRCPQCLAATEPQLLETNT